ncbi:MAG: hypothetical protein WC749_08225 [Dehalococcoidia bacterium]
MISDTLPEAERIQIQCLRRMGPGKRLETSLELCRLERKLLEAGIRHRHPEYSDEQVRLALIRIILPQELFDIVYPQGRDIRP